MGLKDFLRREHMNKVAKDYTKEESLEAIGSPGLYSIKHQVPASTAIGAGVGAIAGGLLSRGSSASPRSLGMLGLGAGAGAATGGLVGVGNGIAEGSLRAEAAGHIVQGQEPAGPMVSKGIVNGVVGGGLAGLAIGSQLPGVLPMAVGGAAGAATLATIGGVTNKLVADSQKKHFDNLFGEDGKFDPKNHEGPLRIVARF